VTLAFLVYRKGTFKVVGSLIQAALDRGHRVVLVRDPGLGKRGEEVTDADVAAWPAARVIDLAPREPLLAALRAERAEAVIAPSLHTVLTAAGREAEMPALRGAGIRLYSVDYILDHVTSAPEAYRVVDTTFYASEYARQLHWRVMAERFAAMPDVDRAARSAVCGSTMLDQLALVDRAAVRKEYGIGHDQPVVVLMSLKMNVPEPLRRFVWAGRPLYKRAAQAVRAGQAAMLPRILRGDSGYRDVVAATRAFCDRAGGVLVAKSRAKNEDPAFVHALSHHFREDVKVYPYTSMELLAVADLCVHFQSGAVLEAAFAGVPSLSVVVPQTHLHRYPTFSEVFGTQPGSMQAFPGVVWSFGYREAAATLARASLGDFRLEREARARYVKQYVGFDDTRSSVRVLESIERGAGR
jgi:hypothetical protein